jgi:hypothetical protein
VGTEREVWKAATAWYGQELARRDLRVGPGMTAPGVLWHIAMFYLVGEVLGVSRAAPEPARLAAVSPIVLALMFCAATALEGDLVGRSSLAPARALGTMTPRNR